MRKTNHIEPLNVDGKRFLAKVGVPHNDAILKDLRELKLIHFFKVGRKFYYPHEDIKIISDKLRKNQISIRTNGGYYVHINS